MRFLRAPRGASRGERAEQSAAVWQSRGPGPGVRHGGPQLINGTRGPSEPVLPQCRAQPDGPPKITGCGGWAPGPDGSGGPSPPGSEQRVLGPRGKSTHNANASLYRDQGCVYTHRKHGECMDHTFYKHALLVMHLWEGEN